MPQTQMLFQLSKGRNQGSGIPNPGYRQQAVQSQECGVRTK
jgi:hypothetical protein